MVRQIALYGRGGVGATTIAANISAALVDDGLKVVQVGCDPRHDSCGSLHSDLTVPTVMDYLRAGRTPQLNDLVIVGYKGIQCLELGDPFDDSHCTAQAITRALEVLQQLDFVRRLDPDLVIYDIPWESGCARFTGPLRSTFVAQAYVVVSADFMSLSRANGILKHLGASRDDSSPIKVGLIANGLTNHFEESFVADFARQIGGKLAANIPRSLVVRQSELYGKTVIEAAPHSNQASALRRLARQITAGDAAGPASSLAPVELKRWARQWGDLLFEMENGLISDGAAI